MVAAETVKRIELALHPLPFGSYQIAISLANGASGRPPGASGRADSTGPGAARAKLQGMQAL